MTIHYYSVNLEDFKVSLSVVAKTNKSYDEMGSHEDHPRIGWPRVTSAAFDLPASEIASKHLSLESTSVFSKIQVAATFQHQLFRGGWMNQSFVAEVLQNRPPLKETKRKKRIVWAKKYKEWSNIQESSSPWDYYAASWTTADPSPYNLAGTFIIKHELIYINVHINTMCITFLDRSSITKWIKEVHPSIAWSQVSLEVIRELRTWRKL